MRPRLMTMVVCVSLAAFAAPGDRFFIDQYELVKITDNTYVFHAAVDQRGGFIQSNSVVLIGGNSVLVVDTGQFPLVAEWMVAEIKKLTAKPVRYIVTTHWHLDHSWGNQSFVKAWPNVTIISHEFTRTMVRQGGEKYLKDDLQIKQNEEQVKQLRAILAKGKTSSGKPLTEQQIAKLNFNAESMERSNQELRITVNIPPTVGYDKELTIDLGKRPVKVIWLGRANTAGDSIIWVPDVKLLATGDALVHPVPFAFGSYLSEWPSVMQKMIDINAATIVPGHGQILHDNSYLELVRDLTAATYSRVRELADKGLSFEEVQKQINLDDLKAKLTQGDAQLERGWRDLYLPGALDRAYQEATGKMKSELED